MLNCDFSCMFIACFPDCKIDWSRVLAACSNRFFVVWFYFWCVCVFCLFVVVFLLFVLFFVDFFVCLFVFTVLQY